MTRLDQILRRWRFGAPIVVVSGLPRSGTSLAMKMLAAGGMPILTDGLREADEDNPNGYFEYERVKELDKAIDPGWLRDARGRAIKIVSPLLTWLPEDFNYRVVFMRRDLDEVLASQQTMLQRRGESERAGSLAGVRQGYQQHLEQLDRFLAIRPCFQTLQVGYRDVLERPVEEARRVASFIGRRLDVNQMAGVVDPRLYRNRAPSSGPPSSSD